MRKRPRVTIDARLLLASGIGTYLSNLLPRIIAARPDWRFDLIGRPEDLQNRAWCEVGDVSLIPCDAAVYGVAEQIQLAFRIPRDSDLFWSPHYNIPLSYWGRLLVTVHDLCHLALPRLVEGAHRRAYARAMFGAVRRRASRVVCDSEFTKSEFRRLVGWRDDEPVIVHLGVDPRWFTLKATDRPHRKPFLLFVGNVKPHKNLGTLVEAFQLVARSIPHDLVIAGKQTGLITGDQSGTQAAAALGDRIRFTGELAQDALEQFYLHADALVFPSLYEGFGLPPLEAMACGCPTIVARAASLPEICGDATLYFDPADPAELGKVMTRLLSDPELRDDLSQRGRRQAAGFTWERCAQETTALMESVLTG